MENKPKISEIKTKSVQTAKDGVNEEVEIGYTSSDKSSRDSSGHYSLTEAKEIDTSSTKCYAKQYFLNNGQNRYYIKFGPDGKIV